MTSQLIPTLTGHDYSSDEVFARERERIFHRSWFYVCRADRLSAGDRFVADVAGESVLVVKDRDGRIHAHANVCRHRGARLCEESGPGSKAGITCPYHAWTYSLDGRLIGTPHLAADEIDRDSLSLWSVACEVWQGFVFVNLSAGADVVARLVRVGHGFGAAIRTPAPRRAAHGRHHFHRRARQLEDPRRELPGVPALLVGAPRARRSRAAVQDGLGRRPPRDDGGVTIRGNSFSITGRSSLPVLPHMPADESESYYGATVFPNMFIDITGTCVIVSSMWPKGADSTTVVMEYLFAPETIAAAGFDPSEIVEFSELVGKQDYDVSERVQRGVSSRYFDHGVLAPQDHLIVDFLATYRSQMTD